MINSALAHIDSVNLAMEGPYDQLAQRVEAGEAAAVIRLSEGEGIVLGYPRYVSRHELDRQLRLWFGRDDFPDAVVAEIRQDLLEAARSKAALLCLPGRGRVEATGAGEPTRDARLCAGLWLTLAEEGVISEGATYGLATFNKWIQTTRQLTSLLVRDAHYTFISRSVDAAYRVASAFEMSDFTFHSVPGESHSTFESTHYPQRYRALRAILRAQPAGIALVGAGVLGKMYCADVANAGGVAIDMGAVFDVWSGHIPEGRPVLQQQAANLSVEHLISGKPS